MSRAVVARPVRLALLAAVLLASGVARDAQAGDPPKIRSVTPTSAPRGGTVDVVIEGTNLYPIEDVVLGVSDIGSALQPGNNDRRLVVRLTIPDTANAGAVTITVKTKEGAVRTDRFSVRLRTPTVTKISPAALHRGATVETTITGTLLSFPGYETKVTTDGGITAERNPKSTASSLMLKVVVPMTAPAGAHAFTLETSDGKVVVPFTVLLSPPTLASITPATVLRGTSPTLALVGTNLVGGSPPALAVPDSAVRIEPAGETTMTAASVKVSVAADAAIGPRLLVLQTPDGVATIPFTVTTKPPRALVVAPAGAHRGQAVDVTRSGDAVPADAEWRFVPDDPAVRLEKSPGGLRKIVVAADARPGTRTLVATTHDGAATVPFHVGLRPPAVAGVTPAEVAPGTEATLAVEGQNLDGTTLSLAQSGTGVEAPASAPAKTGLRVKVAADARPGPRALLVRSPDGSAIGRFVVTGPAAASPSLDGGTPGRVARGRATTVVLTGINLTPAGGAAPTVSARGADDAALAVKVLSSSANRISVEVSPAAGAALGGGLLLVTTPEGSTAVSLTVDPALPAIAKASPTTFTRPGEAEITIEGAGLEGPGAAAPKIVLTPVRGGAELPATVTAHAPDRVTAKATLPPEAAPGTWLLVLTTEEGGAAAALVVEPVPPAVDGIDPKSIGVPASVEFAVLGKNLLEPDGKPPKVTVTRVGSSSNVEARVTRSAADGLLVLVKTPAGALGGPHLLVVRTADGTAAGVIEVVNAPPPVVSGVDVAEGGRLTNVMTTIRGSGLAGATEVLFEGRGVTAVILPGGSEKELPVRITVAKDADLGARALRVVAPGGVSGAAEKAVFTVK